MKKKTFCRTVYNSSEKGKKKETSEMMIIP